MLVALNERIQTEQDSNKLISDLVEYLKSLQAAGARIGVISRMRWPFLVW